MAQTTSPPAYIRLGWRYGELRPGNVAGHVVPPLLLGAKSDGGESDRAGNYQAPLMHAPPTVPTQLRVMSPLTFLIVKVSPVALVTVTL